MSAVPVAAVAASPSVLVRLDVAWTVSCRALGTSHGYQSAVLHAELTWTGEPDAWHAAHHSVSLESGARRTALDLPAPVEARIRLSGAWAHLEVRAARQRVLVASFEHGRLAYCVGGLPAMAGLRGGTYDSPTGLLDASPVPCPAAVETR